jgi:hypothetical protein
MSTKQRSMFFSFWFIALFFIILTLMTITLRPYLASWLTGYMQAPFPEIVSWFMIFFVDAVFVLIFGLIAFLMNRRKAGP